MVMGDTDLTPWDMGTFGSRTTPRMGPQLRTMAAAARQMLLEVAAQRWHVAPDGLSAADGKVTDSEKSRSLAYGELTHGEKLVKTVSSGESLTAATQWKIAGVSVPKADGRDFVTGKHKYPSDMSLPEMMFGAVLRPDGIVLSARVWHANAGSSSASPNCCRWSTSTWSSPCRNRLPRSLSTTKWSSIRSCSAPRSEEHTS